MGGEVVGDLAAPRFGLDNGAAALPTQYLHVIQGKRWIGLDYIR